MLLLGIIFSPLTAHSNPNDIDKVFHFSLTELMGMEVTTPSKSSQKISEAPGTVIVVTQQQIRERGYFNLVDLLEDLPGIDIQRKSRAETNNRIAIRGNQGNFKFIIMRNGFRISGPTGENIAIDDNFPVFHADRVEVIYGPVSALYGRDAFTGVINIITKSVKEVDGVEMSSALGTDDYYYNYLNFGQELTSKIDLRFGGHWQQSENPDLAEAYPDRYQGFQQDLLNQNNTVAKTAATRGDRYIGDSDSYSVYFDLDFMKDFKVGYSRSFFSNPSTVNANPRRTLFTEESEFNTLMESFYSKYEYELTSKLTTVSSIDFSTFELLPSSKFTNDFADFSGFKYAESERLNVEQQFNYNVDKKHDLVGGVVFQNFDRIPRTADLPQEYDPDKDPGDQGLLYTNTTIPILFFPDSFQNYGAYIQGQSKWNDWLTTSIGIRFDYDSRFGETFNPRLGATMKPGKDTVVEVLYSEAFLAPSPRAFNHFGSFDGTINADGEFETFFFFIPNPDLQPEKSRTIELNLTHDITPDFIVSAAGYYTKIDDFVETVSSSTPSFLIPGAKILRPSRFENSGEATIFGVDLRADYQKNFGRFNLKLWANYSWVNGYIDSGDGTRQAIKQASPNKVKTGFTLTHGKYFITPRFIWVDETVIEEDEVGTKADSYGVVHLHAGVNNFYKSLSAFVDVRNLLDVKYFNTGRINRSDLVESPQDPRRVIVGLRVQF
jgi:iron complex outermembrane receptor protein